jgi:hypothetical protein
MEAKELQKILDDHKKWLNNKGDKRADLQGADLQGVDLRGADLRGVFLQGANLRGADLRGAYLQGAYLQGAYLQGVFLQGADLQGADLQGVDLERAFLQGAYLRGADLQGVFLQGANLRGTDLRGVDLRGADLPDFQIPEGYLIVWKQGLRNTLIKLAIPIEAKRTANLKNRKCRAEFADVLEIFDQNDNNIQETKNWNIDYELIYKVGERIYPDKYDDDIRLDCTSGIHFFLTKQEAQNL